METHFLQSLATFSVLSFWMLWYLDSKRYTNKGFFIVHMQDSQWSIFLILQFGKIGTNVDLLNG